ncbi:MAG: hypothetical protein DME82_12740 [Verrucomicrobia bacterium]|nr:MAG: hypothetical protein DME82_12740 [Verrucomicrobiota bacterium]
MLARWKSRTPLIRAGFANGAGSNIAFSGPFVEFGAGTAGVKFFTASRGSHPDREFTITFACQLYGPRLGGLRLGEFLEVYCAFAVTMPIAVRDSRAFR